MFKKAILCLVLCLVAAPSAAHDFWIEHRFVGDPEDQSVVVTARIGENFVGDTLPFEPRAFAKAIWSGPDATEDLSRRSVADDLSTLALLGDGLHVLAVESFPRTHVYRSESDFNAHLAGYGLSERVNTVSASVTNDGTVLETYRRFAKSLVRFPESSARDTRVGLEKEWVQEKGGFRLYSGNRPVKQQPVDLFCRQTTSDEVAFARLQTDRAGRVVAQLPPDSNCLLNSVLVARQPDGSWRSDWVSVSFDSEILR